MTIVWLDNTLFNLSIKWTFGLLPLVTDKNKVIMARIVKVFLCEHVVLLGMHLEIWQIKW